MKKLTLLILLTYLIISPAHANIEQGVTAFNKGELQLAKELLLQTREESYQKYLHLAQIALANGNLDNAENHIERALKLNQKQAHAHVIYAEIMAKQADSASIFSVFSYIKKVKMAFTTAVELDPQNIEYRHALIQFHINAPGLAGGDINEALKHAQNLKQLDPLSGAIALIQIYGQLEDLERLKELTNSAMLDFPNEPELYLQLGNYHQKQENYDEALIYYRKAATMVITSNKQRNAKYSALFQIGRATVQSENNLSEGKKALAKYLNEAVITSSMPPKDWAKYRYANVTEALGDKSKAMQLYKILAQETTDKELQNQLKKRIK